jgi:DNA polymerase-1
MSHLLLVDAHAVLHRAYHSIPPLTVNGQPINAIYGFYSMLLSAIDQLHPDYIAVALDTPGPTFRQTEFIGYRAKRKAPDRDLISQLPLLPQTLNESRVATFSMGGYEADDILATLARRSLKKFRRQKGEKQRLINQVTIITGDKDLMQLVNDQIQLYVPIRGLSEIKIYDPAGVKEKLGVSPSQVVDLKALMGDSSDNYPGVAGIGPKAATDLLASYGDLNSIYNHLDEIKPAIREKLIKDKDSAFLSQRLATLIDNIPLRFYLRQARWQPATVSGLSRLFDDLNFKSLNARLHKKFPSSPLPLKPKIDPNQGSLF